METEWAKGFTAALVIPDKEFAKLTRSTIPLLCYWRDHNRALETLSRALDLPDLLTAHIEFEAQTESVGRAEPSHTDVMLTSPSASVAVEAKWTEPEYQTVAIWKTKVRKPLPVITHWLDRLRPFAEPPGPDAVSNLVYQMLHRCASACEPGRQIAAMVYLVFTDQEHSADRYATALKKFVETVRPTSRLRVRLIEIPMKKTPEYYRIEKLLAQKPLHHPRFRPASIMRRAVRHGELFEFLEPIVRGFE
jgi:hypothetical protein